MLILLVISVIVNVGLGVVTYRALQRAIISDEFCEMVVDRLVRIITDIRAVDLRGSFEADDEVGTVFKAILHLIETLEVFIPEGETDGQTQEDRYIRG